MLEAVLLAAMMILFIIIIPILIAMWMNQWQKQSWEIKGPVNPRPFYHHNALTRLYIGDAGEMA